MGALRQLSNTSMNMQSSMSKLSSGLRINSGADDPAGLQISEGFRSQISSMDQALRNNADATNYAKTAEGALSEVNKLLNDARSLAIANSNDATLSTEQKQANQNQLNSILSSVDRIATTTSYGTKKLLDGSSGVSVAVTDQSKIASVSIGGQVGTAAGSASISANGTLSVAVTTAAVKASLTGKTLTGAATVAAAEAMTVTSAGTLSINGVSINVSSGMTQGQLRDSVNAVSGQTGVVMKLSSNGTNGTVSFEAAKFGASGNSVNVSDNAGNVLAAAGTSALTGGVNAIATVTVSGTAANFQVRGSDDGLTLSDTAGNKLVLNASATYAAATVGQVTAGAAQFQIGANAGQTATLALSSMSSASLSLSGIDILSTSTASSALSAIDTAINNVSKQRGAIGNFMRNTIDSNTRALQVAKENLEASDSAIRDTDMAAEMTTYTKMQVLQQAGLSMLSQANSSSQSVLALLRG
ncbi:MAG: hypothetical protein JNJ45_08130 [Chthonomonas sp.]|nr:hypothetical protein [Chthonomonas sp.]